MAEKYREMGKAADGMRTGTEALEEARETWKVVRSGGEISWAWFTLEGANYAKKASGDGALADMADAALSAYPDTVWFGCFRVLKPATKFFHVMFISDKVGALKKGKAQLQKSAIFNAWEGGSGEFNLTEMSEATLREAAAKVLRCDPGDIA